LIFFFIFSVYLQIFVFHGTWKFYDESEKANISGVYSASNKALYKVLEGCILDFSKIQNLKKMKVQ